MHTTATGHYLIDFSTLSEFLFKHLHPFACVDCCVLDGHYCAADGSSRVALCSRSPLILVLHHVVSVEATDDD